MPNENMFGDMFIAGFMFAYMGIILLVGAAAYILQSLSLHRIAKRRGIRHPWLSWIPLGFTWMLGSISDQYQYVAKGNVRNKRKSLLVLQILMMVCVVAAITGAVWLAVQTAMTQDLSNMSAAFLLILVAYLALIGMSIAVAIIQYMALYDLYRSCEPNYGVLYLALSILFNIALPVLLIICSGKDLGMPPRKVKIPELPREEDAPADTYEWQPPEETTEEKRNGRV